MEKNKLKIVIPIEVKNRELLSRTFMALKILQKIDCEIIIGSGRSMGQYYSTMKNCVYIDKSISTRKENFIKKMSKNNHYFSLDEEGAYYWFEDLTILVRFSKNLLKYVNRILLWGKKDIDILKKKNFYDKKKFIIFGNPKFEILKKPNISFFDKQKKKLINKYGNYILFVSSFVTNCDTVKNSNESKNFILNNYLKKKSQQRKYLNFVNDKRILENYLNFINKCKDLALAYPNKIIIFRPHPFQDINLVKRRFGKIPNNLKIIYEKELTPWIIACSYYVHSGCTSVLEALFLKKKIINITKKNFLKRHYIFKNISKPFLKKIDCNFLKESKKFASVNIKYFNDLIHNYKNNNYLDSLIELLRDQLILESNFKKENIIRRYYQRFVGLFFYINNRKYFNKSYQDKKLKEINIFEIKSIVKFFSNLPKKKMNSKVVQIDKNLFSISRK